MDSATEICVQSAKEQGALLGEVRALLEQLGGTANLINLHAAAETLACPEVANWEVFREFINTYKVKVLYAQELEAIYRGYTHARANEGRELVLLDQELAKVLRPRPLGEASRRIGQAQLQNLAPLRGEPVAAKYHAAVREGKAEGWHTLVYGLMLAVYCIPLRQGLAGYATQILNGYVQAAGRTFSVSEEDRADLLNALCADLPQRVDSVLAPASR